ncbi:chemotaxis protein CheB, partial [Methylomonas lenta]|uniref:chemotaxis protein CheB n=1 Tax=Methylomonas lenta TaxID=980561 RepID=UPI000AB37D5C
YSPPPPARLIKLLEPTLTRKTKTPLADSNVSNTAPALPVVDFPIVGIGASAGGLAAFEAFFSGMPVDTDPNMAFVLVQHLAPDHKSLLCELLKRFTKMQVFEVVDGMTVKPNCAYIIPPNRNMALFNGRLQLLEPAQPHGQRLPIDFFFRTLADDLRERAICIVLSGSGSDGSQGVKAVKAAGGMAMAQTPETTEYASMPQSAIATGLVDFVLPPAEMLPQLLAYKQHAYVKGKTLSPATPNTEDVLSKLFVLLRVQTSHDFSLYKRNTIIRRVERRMAVHQINQISDYLHFCQQTPAEINALFRDLLIGVTQFFRDPEEFKALETQVIPRLFADKPVGSDLRLWVAGCSTGEEAYSLAILLQEQMDQLKTNLKVHLFATDIDSRAIETARIGLYPASIEKDISAERLARFFSKQSDGSGYRIQKKIRDLLVFSEQDLIKDPPFSRLDLISCRNVMIYLSGELQKKLLPLFHYALNPGGFLFLGTSESIGDFSSKFDMLDRKAKLYQRKEQLSQSYRLPTGKSIPTLPVNVARTTGLVTAESKLSLREITERALLQHFAAVAMLITARGEILYLHGRSGRYLEPAPGEAGMNILRMAREGLGASLNKALQQAVVKHELVFVPGLQVKTNGDFTAVDLTICPLAGSLNKPEQATLFLVILSDAKTIAQPITDAGSVIKAEPVNTNANILSLQQELRTKEDYLQSNIEELETSNEELKSANEEMQSINEELQSANEELETSKEELQSVNEELSTVNSEFQSKLVDLARANNDMNNLLSSTDIGTIFVDHHLLISRFTPSVTQVINLIPSDIGRPIGHIVSNLPGYTSLVADLLAVLDNLVPKEIEVQTQAGRWFLLRIRPYRTLENVIEGAVITFVDISELKQAQSQLQETLSIRHLAAVVRDARDAILMLAMDGSILAWNPAAQGMYGWTEAEALQKNIAELAPETLRQEAFEIVQSLSFAENLAPYQTQRLNKQGQLLSVRISATALLNQAGEVYAITTTERLCK